MCGLYIPQFRVATHLLHRKVVGEPCIMDDIMVAKHLDLLGNSSYGKKFSIPVELNTGDDIASAAWVPIGQ